MEQDKIAANDLAESSREIKKESNVLQVIARENKTLWYKNVATWISMLALLLSFGTAYFSYTRSKAQDIQSTRAELRGLLQRLVLVIFLTNEKPDV